MASFLNYLRYTQNSERHFHGQHVDSYMRVHAATVAKVGLLQITRTTLVNQTQTKKADVMSHSTFGNATQTAVTCVTVMRFLHVVRIASQFQTICPQHCPYLKIQARQYTVSYAVIAKHASPAISLFAFRTIGLNG